MDYVQYWNIEVDYILNHCQGTELTINRRIITTHLSLCEVLHVDPNQRLAIVQFRGCAVTVTENHTTFSCKDGTSGYLGDQIEWYYKNH